eukprot:176161-Pelagomonas_calceolata.AAC.3
MQAEKMRELNETHNPPIQSSNAQAPSTIKNTRSASKDPPALHALSQNVIIWIALSTFSQAAIAPSSETW